MLAVRDTARGSATAKQLAEQTGRDKPVVLELDLADLTSVRSAADAVLASYDGVDLLVNNAGVMATPQRSTIDGFELQMGTNLGHFALTGLLLPRLRHARVVTVSSFMHRMAGGIGPADLRGGERYEKWDAYSKSKLANLLFMHELQRRASQKVLDLLSVGAHPGAAAVAVVRGGHRRQLPVIESV